MNKIILTSENEEKNKLFQYDTGQLIEFENAPDGANVLLSNNSSATAKRKLVQNGSVEIPNELLRKQGTLKVCLQIVDENSETTEKVFKIPIVHRLEGDPEIAPENQQTFIEEVQSIVDEAKTTADDVQRRADAGLFNGKDGEKGDKGDDGYTPVKGVDYFTDSEIEQIEQNSADKVDLSKCVPTSRKIGNKDLSEDWTYDDLGTQVTLSGVMAQYVVDTVKALTKSVDVQIDGTSIVEDGIANIPIASENTLGIVKTKYNYGIQCENATGALFIRRAKESEIDSHSHQWASIVPANLDYAVKVAMCDGVGAEWTEDEQKKAQIRLGILASEGVGF